MEITVSRFPCGTVETPPSKSAAHRALICAALAGGSVKGVSASADIAATLRCITALGGRYETNAETVHIFNVMTGPQQDAELDCGESGSTLRFFLPLALSFGKRVRFTGKGRLLERPLGPYAAALREHGAQIEKTADGLVCGGTLKAGEYWLAGDVSSQFVSGLLFALPFLEGDSVIRLTTPLESRGYVDLTLEALARAGITVDNTGHDVFTVSGGQQPRAYAFEVEGDWSAAAFLLGAAVLGRPVGVAGLQKKSAQGDRAICRLLERTGAQFLWRDGILWTHTPERLKAFEANVTDVPDLTPALAAVMAFCEGESRITGAARLRMKESDRLATICETLRCLGADVTEDKDSLSIRGRTHLTGGITSAHNDHRIAMMAALAAVRCKTPVTVTGAECVAKSWPGFWKDFCPGQEEAE